MRALKRRQCPCYCTPLIAKPFVSLKIYKNNKLVSTRNKAIFGYIREYVDATKDFRYILRRKDFHTRFAFYYPIEIAKGDKFSFRIKQTSNRLGRITIERIRLHSGKIANDESFHQVWMDVSGYKPDSFMRPKLDYSLVADEVTGDQEYSFLSSDGTDYIFNGDTNQLIAVVLGSFKLGLNE